MTIHVLDPRQLPEGDAPRAAPALPSLSGAVVGFIDNAKIGTARCYDFLEEILRTRYRVREFIRRRKPDATRPIAPDLLAQVAGADAIITGIGD